MGSPIRAHEVRLKLIACSNCHAQYDITGMAPKSAFDCRCGETLEATPPVATDAPVRRCSGCGAIAKNDDELCDYCGSGIVQVVDRGSLICPECYARNLDDARFCLGCGVAFDPQSPAPTLSELRCPCCECWMTSREVGGLEIQECPKCFGLWAPEKRFDALVDRAVLAAQGRSAEEETPTPRVDGGNPAESAVEYRRCPTCDALMIRRNFQKRSGVIVDRCHEHGTWLDAHELERIAGFVLSGRAARLSAIEDDENAAREKSAARDASNRMRSSASEGSLDFSVFGTRRKTSAVETIFDLLTEVLN
jgi:Zn-finger nucleic acid-binding protein